MTAETHEFEHVKQPKRGKSVFTGLLIGGLVGAGTMLLFAPQPGAKTRAEVQQGALHLRERTTETVKEKVNQVKSKANQLKINVQSRAGDLQHQGQDLLVRQLDRVSHAAEAGKKAIQNSQEHRVE